MKKDYTIFTDGHRLRQIMANLLSNALKFTLKGSIEFGYTIKNSNYLQFYVKDTGVGIPKDMIDIVFDRFQQISDHKNINHKGTGLGLAISLNLVHLLESKARQFPWRRCLVFPGAGYSFGRLNKAANQLAWALKQNLGIKSGDKVALLLGNCPEFIIAFFAILKA